MRTGDVLTTLGLILGMGCPSAFAQIDTLRLSGPRLIQETDAVVASDTAYAFFNHNSSAYELGTRTQGPTLRLGTLVRRLKIPSIMASRDYDSTTLSKSYLKPSDVDYALTTAGGAHNLIFPNLKSMIFSGGSLDQCLCEAIRDVARGTAFGELPVKFEIVTDATFAWGRAANTVFKNPQSAQKYLDRNPTLKEIIQDMDDDEVMKLFENFVFSEKENRFCAIQFSNSLHRLDDLALSDYSISIYQENKLIGTIGQGIKKIEVRLKSIQDFVKRAAEADRSENTNPEKPVKSKTSNKHLGEPTPALRATTHVH